MAYNRDLHHLIHSFSQEENQQICNELQKKQSLLLLYERYRNLNYEIASKKTEDHNSLFSDFKNLKNVQTQLKSYLFEMTRNFEQLNIEAYVWKLIRSAQTLFNRCSYKFSLQQLKTAKKLALKNELFELLMLINNIECQIAIAGNIPVKYIRSGVLFEERAHYLEKMENQLDYYLLFDELSTLMRQEVTLRNPEEKSDWFNQILSNPLYSEKNAAKSKRAILMQYDIQRLVATLNNQPKKVLAVVKSSLQEMKKLPKEFIEFMPTNYAIGYLTLIQENQILGIFENQAYWKSLEKVKGLNKRLDVFIYKVTSFLLLHQISKQENNKKAETLKKIENIEKEYRTYLIDLDVEGKFIIPYMLAIFWFSNDEFIRAQEWINQFFLYHQLKPKHRKDILNVCLLFELALHLELKEYILVKSKAINLQRRFKNQNILYQTEKRLLSFFKNTNFFVLSKSQLAEVFEVLNKELIELAQNNSTEKFYHSDYFDWLQWSEKNAKK